MSSASNNAGILVIILVDVEKEPEGIQLLVHFYVVGTSNSIQSV